MYANSSAPEPSWTSWAVAGGSTICWAFLWTVSVLEDHSGPRRLWFPETGRCPQYGGWCHLRSLEQGSAPDGSDHTRRASCSTSRLHADSSPSPMRPMTVVSHSAHIPQIIPLIYNNILYNLCTRGSLLRLLSPSGSASQSEEHDHQKLPSKISSTNVGKLNYWDTVTLAWNMLKASVLYKLHTITLFDPLCIHLSESCS